MSRRVPKKSMISMIADELGIPKVNGAEILAAVSKVIIECLAKGEKVALGNDDKEIVLNPKIVPERKMTGLVNKTLPETSRISVKASDELRKEMLNAIRNSDEAK